MINVNFESEYLYEEEKKEFFNRKKLIKVLGNQVFVLLINKKTEFKLTTHKNV